MLKNINAVVIIIDHFKPWIVDDSDDMYIEIYGLPHIVLEHVVPTVFASPVSDTATAVHVVWHEPTTI